MFKYNELPKTETPTWRLRELGRQALTLSELLSVALWTNDSEAIEEVTGLVNQYGGLAKIPRTEITKVKGLGEKHCDILQAIVELARRDMQLVTERVSIHSPSDLAVHVQYEMGALDHEELWVVLLDTRNNVKKIVRLYKGSVNSAQVRVAEVLRDAIRENASAIALLHNHPSGDPTPSPDDVGLTRAIHTAAKTMDISLLDHLVIGSSGCYVSLKERGLFPC